MYGVQIHLDFKQLDAEFEEVILSFPKFFHFFFEGCYLFHSHVLRQVFVVGLTGFLLLIFEFLDVLLELSQIFVTEIFVRPVLLLVHHLLIFVDFVDDARFVLFNVLPPLNHIFRQFGVSVLFGQEFLRVFDLVEVFIQLVEIVLLVP
jgi:hypothetical protein